MADSDDSTNVPASPRPPVPPGCVCLPIGEDSAGMRDLDALVAAFPAFSEVPTSDAVAAMDATTRRLHALEPCSLGDAVTALMAVTVVGGACPPPETVTLITRSVAYLTPDAPQLRRPALERLALDYARRLHGE